MTLKITIAAGAAILAATVAPALAQPAGGHDPFAMLDADSDGRVTLPEFRAHAVQMFGHVDGNGDGRATLDEFRAAHEKMRVEHRGAHPGHEGPPPGGHRGHRGPPPPEQLDADHDGAVTVSEFTAGMEQHFAAADSNHDGAVSREEMQAAHEAMRRGR